MILTICDLEHDRIAEYTLKFTRMFTPKPSACVQIWWSAELADHQAEIHEVWYFKICATRNADTTLVFS